MSKIETNLSGKKLRLNFKILPPGENNIVVDVEGKQDAYKYLMKQFAEANDIAQQIMREADKYIQD